MTSFPLFSPRIAVVVAALGCVGLTRVMAADATDAAPAPAKAEAGLSQHSLDKLTAPVLKSLKLGDDAREAKVRSVLEAHFRAVDAWHRTVDAELKTLWAAWGEARATDHQDEVKAAAIADKIDAVYAGFQAQHDAFGKELAATLSAEQVEVVKNALTKEPGLPRTYEAYLQIVPALTEAQKTYIHDTLVVAREEAVDSLDKKERISLFKKQKVKVQLYIDAQGYDWKKSYAAFVKKLKGDPDEAKEKKE